MATPTLDRQREVIGERVLLRRHRLRMSQGALADRLSKGRTVPGPDVPGHEDAPRPSRSSDGGGGWWG